MEFNYLCTGLADMHPKHWEGHIKILQVSDYYEVEVTSRQNAFHMIFGSHSFGNYICIPNWGIGTELASLSDSFWNLERLRNTYPELSIVDAISIVDALVALSDYIDL